MANCVVIGKKLITSYCPLGVDKKGHQCAWRHRKTGLCTYDAEFADGKPTAQEIAARVGELAPPPDAVVRIERRILDTYKKSTAK